QGAPRGGGAGDRRLPRRPRGAREPDVPRLLISADSHVQEPLDLWTTHLPVHLRAAGPRVEARGDARCILVEDTVVRRLPSRSSTTGEDRAATAFTRGASDPDARLHDLDADGVWGDVIYPNLAFFCCFHIRGAELQVAVARLYNDWVADQFIGASDRFAPIALLSILDLDPPRAELERVRRRGFRGVPLPAHTDLRPYNAPVYERLWASAAVLAMPLPSHAGTGRSQTPAHGPGGAVVNYVVT